MAAWLFIVGVSALIGSFTAIIFRQKKGILIAAFIPWFIMFLGIPKSDSMWLIALFFGGTVAAVVGAVSFIITYVIRNREN